MFITIAFFGIMPHGELLPAIVTQWLFKIAYETLATPFTYLVVNFLKRVEGVDVYDHATPLNPFLVAEPNAASWPARVHQKRRSSMQFLVTGEWVEVGALLPAQMVPIMDGLVLPSLETFVQWEREGAHPRRHPRRPARRRFRARGGLRRGGGDLLSSLPFWGLVKWDVTALQSFASAVARDRAAPSACAP